MSTSWGFRCVSCLSMCASSSDRCVSFLFYLCLLSVLHPAGSTPATLVLQLQGTTTGWLGFGFGDQNGGSMKGADMVTVQVAADGMTVSVQDRYAGFTPMTLTGSPLKNGQSSLPVHPHISHPVPRLSSSACICFIMRLFILSKPRSCSLFCGCLFGKCNGVHRTVCVCVSFCQE